MKVLTRTFKFFLLFLGLVIIAVIAFVATFDANNYKSQIIEQVENATGRDFTIDGDVHLSVFPWVGLKVDDVALGNEKGFTEKPFAAIKQLDIKVNVLPLIKKEVQINIVRLHGLNVSLEVAKDNSNNWSSLSESTSTDEVPVIDEEEKEKEKETSVLQSLQVEGFEFIDAAIHYDDRTSGNQATVSALNLTTGAIAFDQPVAVEFAARIENKQPVIDTALKLTTKLTFNKSFTTINLRDLVFTVLAEANEFIKQKEEVKITSSIEVLIDEQRITLQKTQLAALGVTTLADIVVSQFLQTPIIQGAIEIQPFNARQLASRAGVELPAMAKADALHRVALKTKIKLQGEKLEANDFTLNLDGSTLSGWLHMIDISKQQLRYELAFDALNVNDYLPPVTEETADIKIAANGSAGAASTGDTATPATGDEKIALPIEMMRALDVEGDFRIAALTAMEYEITQFLMTLKAKDGEMKIKPLSLQVLEGQMNASVNLNVQKEQPAYAINLDLNQVQAGPVVNPILDGMTGDKPMKMDGTVNVSMDVKTKGDTVNKLKSASVGKIILDMKKTRVDGFDPEYFMRSSIADYIHSKGFGLSNTIMGNYTPRDVTVFDKIHSTVNIANGKARSNDFIMDSKRVQVRAEGYADIMANTLDVTSSIKLPRSKTAVEKILDEPIYVRVHGPFETLAYEIDKQRLKKSTTDVLKNEAKAKVDAEKARAKEKAKQELKKTTDKVQDKLKDKLKGLF